MDVQSRRLTEEEGEEEEEEEEGGIKPPTVIKQTQSRVMEWTAVAMEWRRLSAQPIFLF